MTPQHLDEQVAFTLDRAIASTFDIFGDWAKECGVQVMKDYKHTFKADFNELRAGLESVMRGDSECVFDAHKLSTIACLATLTSRPMIVARNGEAHSVNEIVAFFLAVYIMRDFQIARACGNDVQKRGKVRAKIQELDVPPLIYGIQEVRVAFVVSFRFLSSSLRGTTFSQKVNLIPIISMLMFYVDNYSYTGIKNIAKATA
jgi:hypothetical protein